MAGGNIGGALQAKLKGDIVSFPVHTGTVIYRGSLVALNGSGGLIEASDATGIKFVGVAEEKVDNSSGTLGAAGNLYCRVRRKGLFKLTKDSANALSDVGAVFYAKTAQSGSVDQLVTLTGSSTYKIAVGVCTKVEDTVGTSTQVWIDITPNTGGLLLASAITTHEAKADQTAHTEDAILPVVATLSSATPTVTGANFIGREVLLTNAGTSTFTLPTSGVGAGTICRFVKGSSTIGNLIITGGTLLGQQVTSNVFRGCPSNGDSVAIMCVSTNVYKVVSVSQQVNPQTVSGDDPTITASQFMTGEVILSKAGATTTATTLPASGVPAGARCQFVKTGSAGSVKVTATTLVGAGTTSNVCTVQDAAHDVITVECVGDDSYRIVSSNIS